MFKRRSLFFVLIHLLLFLTLLAPFAINSVFAQSTKPRIPDFTLNIVEHPYDVAPITTKNPYTGETTITQEGYRATYRTIELCIKNQPFTPYETSNGNYINLCYNVSIKGHYDNNWKYCPDMWKTPLIASQGDYTIISFGGYVEENDRYSYSVYIPESGQLDFRVEALIGYYTKTEGFQSTIASPYYIHTFSGKTSGWSNIQTITVPSDSPTSSQPLPSNPLSSSNVDPLISNQPDSGVTVFGLALWVGITLVVLFSVIVVLLVIIVVYLRRKSVS
jgi:hypothetical protein